MTCKLPVWQKRMNFVPDPPKRLIVFGPIPEPEQSRRSICVQAPEAGGKLQARRSVEGDGPGTTLVILRGLGSNLPALFRPLNPSGRRPPTTTGGQIQFRRNGQTETRMRQIPRWGIGENLGLGRSYDSRRSFRFVGRLGKGCRWPTCLATSGSGCEIREPQEPKSRRAPDTTGTDTASPR